MICDCVQLVNGMFQACDAHNKWAHKVMEAVVTNVEQLQPGLNDRRVGSLLRVISPALYGEMLKKLDAPQSTVPDIEI